MNNERPFFNGKTIPLNAIVTGQEKEQITSRTQRRRKKREEEVYQPFLLNLCNRFFKYCIDVQDKELQETFLEINNKKWKTFVKNWNASGNRMSILREEDFLAVINNHLDNLTDEKNATKGV